ncbi:uncharacterized protein LDX57_006814 [Aspergillus melleus]|uniref:uncharacterized protein n=1 Tax=Aspergillus melleus TaxID=138277 RepID=UPI001E8CF969|nr:uncharacterized protein LDX57_006814 [Aspergillus melleus]KAH8429144.1 hypothetical protein LDX57_006814 [Aspergillus melleus]
MELSQKELREACEEERPYRVDLSQRLFEELLKLFAKNEFAQQVWKAIKEFDDCGRDPSQTKSIPRS